MRHLAIACADDIASKLASEFDVRLPAAALKAVASDIDDAIDEAVAEAESDHEDDIEEAREEGREEGRDEGKDLDADTIAEMYEAAVAAAEGKPGAARWVAGMLRNLDPEACGSEGAAIGKAHGRPADYYSHGVP